MAYTRFGQRISVGWNVADSAIAYYPAFDPDLNLYYWDAIDNGYHIGGYHPDAPFPGGKYGQVKFKTWVRGADSGRDIPEMTLLMACGFADTDQTSSHKYTLSDPHLDGEGDGTVVAVDVNICRDKLSEPVEDAVGNMTAHFVAGQLPTIDWEFVGIPGTRAGTLTQPSVTTANLSDPAPCINYGATIATETVGTREIHIALNNKLEPRPDVNGTYGYAASVIPGRAPEYEILHEADTTDFDPITYYIARTEVAVAFTHDAGGGVNNELDIALAGVIAETPTLEEDSDGVLCYRIKLKPEISSTAMYWDWKDA